MKRYIRSSWGSMMGDYKQYDTNEWLQEDIELHKSIDWQARNYEEYPVEGETFDGPCYVYGLGEMTVRIPTVKFQLMLRANPVFPPYYAPVDPERVKAEACRRVGINRNDAQIVGPMSSGHKYGKYDVHGRFETQELYDVLSD